MRLLRLAKIVFDAILEPNQVAWSSLVSCSCQCGENFEALRIFSRSQKAGVKPNEFSCVTILGACPALETLEFGMQVHSHVIKCGTRMDQFVITGLINFYAKCRELILALQAFREVENPHLTAWTALIGGCVHLGKGREAIDLFYKLHSTGFKPSERTFSSVLGSFADAMEIEAGEQLHSLIVKLGFISFTFVANAVIDFYSKSGLLEESLKTFKDMDSRDVVTWNSMIAGHVNLGCYEEGVKFLRCMLVEGFEPNLYTYSSILSICGDLPTVEWGKQSHCCIFKRLSDARRVFNNLPSKNLVSWNTMLVGYAQHGFGIEALDIYGMMQIHGIKPNDITFIEVLSACGHVGLLEEGLRHFDLMTKNDGITPRTDHLACMVSIFARKGQTRGRYDFIRSFPMEPDKVVWRCLLSSCKTHKDMDLGKYAAEKILSIDPDDTSAHIMLSNIYAVSKMWKETAHVRRLMKEKALKKDPGYSWMEPKNKIYSFSASNNAHFQGNGVREVLNGLTGQLFDAGYVPNGFFSLHYEE